jgi:hypothetical protein
MKDIIVHFVLDGKVIDSLYMVAPPRVGDRVEVGIKVCEVSTVTWVLGTDVPGKAQVVRVVLEDIDL